MGPDAKKWVLNRPFLIRAPRWFHVEHDACSLTSRTSSPDGFGVFDLNPVRIDIGLDTEMAASRLWVLILYRFVEAVDRQRHVIK